MAILTDPLFSDEARGQVAKALVFRRSAVHPSAGGFAYHPVNWSPGKIAQAQAWKTLCNTWRTLSDDIQLLWSDSAPGVLTGFNYFMQEKGVFPFPFCYEPPAWDEVFFDFTDLPYTPPGPDAITFIWEECR